MGLLIGGCSTGGATTSGSPSAASSSRGSTATPAPSSEPAVVGFDAQRVAQVLSPAVATIIVNLRQGTAEGSGFVIAHDSGRSYLATNNHVVEGATRVQVLMMDGQHFTASVKGADPLSDVAVVEVANGSLPVAGFGDSTGLRVGQPVVAIGSPLGNQGSVTRGVISALHRTITAGSGQSSETLPDVLQTDAPINPGNSGGPLADAAGQVVGMNTAGSSSSSNIGFAIPSAIVKRITTAEMAGQKPGHPYLGISTLEAADALERGLTLNGYGALVQSVVASCPAAQAGVRTGDVIQAVAGVELRNGQTLGGVLQTHNPGDQVKLTVLHGSSTTELTVKLADQPASGTACA